jgi:hypothetical protein
MMTHKLCHILLFFTLCGFLFARVAAAPADNEADCEGWANSGECDNVRCRTVPTNHIETTLSWPSIAHAFYSIN